jgi:hypothetical protein
MNSMPQELSPFLPERAARGIRKEREMMAYQERDLK